MPENEEPPAWREGYFFSWRKMPRRMKKVFFGRKGISRSVSLFAPPSVLFFRARRSLFPVCGRADRDHSARPQTGDGTEQKSIPLTRCVRGEFLYLYLFNCRGIDSSICVPCFSLLLCRYYPVLCCLCGTF